MMILIAIVVIIVIVIVYMARSMSLAIGQAADELSRELMEDKDKGSRDDLDG